MRSRVLVATLGLLVLAACDDRITSTTPMVFDPPAGPPDGGDPPGETATFALVQTRVLGPYCALSGCHANGAYPNLSAAEAYAGLVNAPSSVGYPQVTAGDPDASYLLTKITGGAGMLGQRMPLGAPPLDAALVALVRDWIQNGALPQ